MPLDDVAARPQRHVIKRIRELTKPAAHHRNEASALQHAADDEAVTAARPANLLPEAEHGSCRHHDAIELPDSSAEVGHLAELINAFAERHVRP